MNKNFDFAFQLANSKRKLIRKNIHTGIIVSVDTVNDSSELKAVDIPEIIYSPDFSKRSQLAINKYYMH